MAHYDLGRIVDSPLAPIHLLEVSPKATEPLGWMLCCIRANTPLKPSPYHRVPASTPWNQVGCKHCLDKFQEIQVEVLTQQRLKQQVELIIA